MLSAIDRDKYEVVPIGITRDGSWVQVADEPARLAITGGQLPSVEAVAQPTDTEAAPGPCRGARLGGDATRGPRAPVGPARQATSRNLLGDVDIVLPVLHGPFGEDGTIQGLLEIAGVPYVGAGVLSSAVSMDKEYMKLIFSARGLPIGPYVVLREQDWPAGGEDLAAHPERKRVLDDIGALGWPLFVKPARGGLQHRHVQGTRHGPSCARPSRSPAVRPEGAGRAGDQRTRDRGGGPWRARTGHRQTPPCPASCLSTAARSSGTSRPSTWTPPAAWRSPRRSRPRRPRKIRRLAAAAVRGSVLRGLARVDFFYTPAGQIVLNEINTIPGLSPASYFQKMWEATGLPFPQLIDRLIRTALRRSPGLR